MAQNTILLVSLGGLVGLLAGWLIRGFAMGRQLRESESNWAGKMSLLESERTRLAGELTAATAEAASAKGKLAGLENSIQAQAAAGEAERAKLAAELEAAVQARTALQADQTARSAAWRLELDGLRARLSAAEGLAADLRAKAALAEGDAAAAAKSAKDWAGKFGALQNTHLALREEMKGVAAEGELKGVVDALRKRAKDAEDRLALLARQKEEAAAKAEAESGRLRAQLAAAEDAQLAAAAAASDEAGALRETLSHHEITIRVQRDRISELENGQLKIGSA